LDRLIDIEEKQLKLFTDKYAVNHERTSDSQQQRGSFVLNSVSLKPSQKEMQYYHRMNLLKRFDDWKTALYTQQQVHPIPQKPRTSHKAQSSSAYLNHVQTRVSKLIPNFGDRISPFYASPRDDNVAAISEEASSAMHTDSEYEESDWEACEVDEREYEGLAEKR
jgi:hypothetical protein